MFGLFARKPKSAPILEFAPALAALFIHVARADSHYAQQEITLIEALLVQRFDLSPDQAQDLRIKSEKLEEDANDTVRFTRVIKGAVAYEDRLDIVRDLWRVILVDDARDMHENGLMRLIVNLLGINDRDSAFARQQVDVSK